MGGAVIKILLVEDDPDILDLTSYVLRRERFVVTEATDGAQALRRWKTDRPDLVIMDLGLPGLDGFEVLRRIREEDQTPILIITGRKDAHDILRAFNLGTDDFVPKPFEFRELIARVRAILRRTQAAHAETVEPSVQLDGLTLDPVPYEVTWRNESVRLTPTEFRILYLLVTNAGHVVPASRLYTYVWGSDGADANALRSHISHLRRKLEIGGSSPGTISSIPAVGYIFRSAERADAAAMSGPMSAASREAGSAA
ncbi:MAG: response regulator transcription factor [Chloroflexi bacterium]|nr:MAG: response regulator transcription factor [Chloroflexota bacterium]TMF59014.1 MAG: response regulator transcription factor [Chloroflexota bacterium]